MRNPKSHATKIVHRYEAESVKDATEYLRKHGSFAGMHLVNSPSRAAIIDEQCATIIDMNGFDIYLYNKTYLYNSYFVAVRIICG